MDALIAELSWVNDPTAWAGLATLVLLEVVLGIDNLVFIAILADKLPEHQRKAARVIGLSLALLMRLGLLATVSWIVTLTAPLFTIFGIGFSWRSIILIVGGAFLLWKATMELHERLEGGHGLKDQSGQHAVFWQVIAQIVVLDAIFSMDAVITAVGMVQHITVMMVAVIIAVGIMLISSGPLMRFVSRHPTVVVLCLGFLLMIGFSLVVEGLGFHIPKGYLYAAIGFSILIEAFNQMARRNHRKRVTSMDLRDRTARTVLRLLRGDPGKSEGSHDGGEELDGFVGLAGAPVFAPEESLMIERVLRLRDRSVRSIMVPRPDVVWLDVNDAPEAILKEISDSGRSRFPVSRGDVDELVGVVHAKDLLDQHARTGTVDIAAALREPVYVSEGVSVLKLLSRFQASNIHMGVVIDEHGTFEGIVTPTDILIAIAGDFPERAGDEVPDALQQEDGSWMLEGSMAIEEVEQVLGVEDMARDEDFTTLAGFILDRLAHMPKVGESVDWQNLTFTVEELEGHRIGRVSVRTQAA